MMYTLTGVHLFAMYFSDIYIIDVFCTLILLYAYARRLRALNG
jgi:hypothetical protein